MVSISENSATGDRKYFSDTFDIEELRKFLRIMHSYPDKSGVMFSNHPIDLGLVNTDIFSSVANQKNNFTFEKLNRENTIGFLLHDFIEDYEDCFEKTKPHRDKIKLLFNNKEIEFEKPKDNWKTEEIHDYLRKKLSEGMELSDYALGIIFRMTKQPNIANEKNEEAKNNSYVKDKENIIKEVGQALEKLIRNPSNNEMAIDFIQKLSVGFGKLNDIYLNCLENRNSTAGTVKEKYLVVEPIIKNGLLDIIKKFSAIENSCNFKIDIELFKNFTLSKKMLLDSLYGKGLIRDGNKSIHTTWVRRVDNPNPFSLHTTPFGDR